MTTLDSKPATGSICWMDLGSSNPERSAAFYRDLFGWQARDSGPEFGHYVIFTLDGRPVGGMMPATPGGAQPDGWMNYVAVRSATDLAADVSVFGGTVLTDVVKVGELGSSAVIAGPDGATLGLWEADNHQGFGAVDEHGAPTWYELSTRDAAAAERFYSDLFGWEYETQFEGPEMSYVTATLPHGPVAAIMDAGAALPAEVPAHWATYLHVDDTETTLARLAELGGTVLQGPDASPYGVLTLVADPTGATFKLVSRPEAADEPAAVGFVQDNPRRDA